MSTAVKDEIRRWTANRKNPLAMKILQGETTVVATSRSYDLSPQNRDLDQ